MTNFYWFLGHEQFQPEELVEHAVLAEAAGFDGVMVSEHFSPWVDDVGAAGFAWETMAAIAMRTSKIHMMTTVTTPLWRMHPAVVAQAAATLDRLSGGRFTLGVGSGEALNEVPLGYEFPGYKERSGRLREAIELMTQLLAGDKVNYAGQYYQTKAAKLYSPPTHGVPIYMAAGGPQSATLAGTVASGLITSVKDIADAKTKAIEPAQAAAAGRDFAIVATHWAVYAQNDDEAWQAIQAWRGLRAPNRLNAGDPAELRQAADSLPREEILSKYSVLDSAQAYIDAYSPLVTELGAHAVGFESTSVDQPALIKMIGSDVLPALRAL